MDEHTLKVLEFNKITEMLSRFATFPLGRELALKLKPSPERNWIERAQRETSELKEIMELEGGLPLGGIVDLREHLKRATVEGACLEAEELMEIKNTLTVARKTKRFISGLGEKYPHILKIGKRISLFPKLEDSIGKCLSEEGEVTDRASPELARIRREIKTTSTYIKERLEALLRSTSYQKAIQEPLITVRNDRYVIPVKQEFKSIVPGIVHDQSSSGATLFIEPLELVEQNNRLRMLVAEEQEEIHRILLELTSLVREKIASIRETLDLLAELDLISAKTQLSLELKAVEPALNEEGYINIIQGRHPLLYRQQVGDKQQATGNATVVPIDVRLGKDFDILVITGPNTGGKTVTLKTIGLLTLMAQAGLHVPAMVGTEIGIFPKIYGDIGDEQSIEQNLSTFSSHMIQVVKILKEADSNSLVLIDELGAGTDPSEGASLGRAVLESLLKRKAKTVITTHYGALKTIAFTEKMVENACVEFDERTLQPTYRLLIGLPGSSNALNIARRLGVPQEVTLRARELLSKGEVRLEDFLKEIEERRRVIQREEKIALERGREAAKLEEEYRWKLKELKENLSKIKQEAYEEAKAILKRAQKEFEVLLSLRKKEASLEEIRAEYRTLTGELKEIEEKLEEIRPLQTRSIPSPKELKPGRRVLVLSLNQSGSVVKEPEEGIVQVQVGIMKINVPLADLELREEDNKESSLLGGVRFAQEISITNKLNLRGCTVDEALAKADKYLDEAYLAKISPVYIIHGKGTGALRRAINRMLKGHPLIANFRVGGYDEGGVGVTVVEMKEWGDT